MIAWGQAPANDVLKFSLVSSRNLSKKVDVPSFELFITTFISSSCATYRSSIMASSVDAKLLKSTKFPVEFNQKVDMQKVNVEVLKKYGTNRWENRFAWGWLVLLSQMDRWKDLGDSWERWWCCYWTMLQSTGGGALRKLIINLVSWPNHPNLCDSQISRNYKFSSQVSLIKIRLGFVRNYGSYAWVLRVILRVFPRSCSKLRSLSLFKRRWASSHYSSMETI